MKHLSVAFIAPGAALTLCGCGGNSPAVKSRIMEEILKTQGTGFFLETAKWATLGGVIGLVVALAAFFGLRALGAYRWEWRRARWLRALTLVLMLVFCPVFAGTAGFLEGVLRGTDLVLQKSQLATEVFPRIGDAGADCMAYLYLLAPRLTDSDSGAANEFPKAQLEAFRANDWELDVAEFSQRLNRVTEQKMRQAIVVLRQAALEEYPRLKGGVGENALSWFLDTFGVSLVRKGAQEQLERFGLDARVKLVLDGLPDEAARAGAANTISHKELSAYLVQEALLPGIQMPIRTTVRSQQMSMLALLLATIAVPVLCFRLAERLRARRGGSPPPAAPQTPLRSVDSA